MVTSFLRHHLIAKGAARWNDHHENMHSSVEPESESDTMKRIEETLRKNHEVEKGLGVQEGDIEGASANASTRSLAGSRVEGMTPGTSVFEGGDASGGYSQMPLPEVSTPSSAEREDVGSAKTGKLGVEKSLHLSQIHMSGSPVTTGREYPLSLDEEKELGGALLAGGEEGVDSTPGHLMKGKASQSKGAPMTSAGPHSTATVSHPSSTQTGPTTTSQEPPLQSTIPEGTATSDTTAGATPSTTMNPTAAGDESHAHKTDAPPKKSKHGFFEKLKIKFEGKERPKGKN